MLTKICHQHISSQHPSSTSKISQSDSSNGFCLSGPDLRKLDQEQKCQAVICTKLCSNYMHQYFWMSLLHHIDTDGITFLSFKSPLRTMYKRWHRGYQTMSVMNNFNQYYLFHDSSKIAQETPPEIQIRIFWCYKNVPKIFFRKIISPEMNRKWHFLDHESNFWELEIHNAT